MTKEEFYKRFGSEEWELLCSKAEFLDVFVAEPFDADLAEAVAYRILTFNAPRFRSSRFEGDDSMCE